MATSSIAAEAVIFSINSAIKLGHNVQRAYAKSIKAKSIVLPLPNFDTTPTLSKVHSFFEEEDFGTGGKQYLSKIERLHELHQKHPAFQVEEENEYKEYYQQLKSLTGNVNSHISADDFVTLLRIRQWETGKMPGTTPLQMVAGTLVEIGIDYFNQVPGALNKNSTFGMTMMHFLEAFDDVSFSDSGKLKEYAQTVLPKLFIVAAEVVSDMSTEISSDEKMQNFIRETGNGIAHDIMGMLDAYENDPTLNAQKRKDHQDQTVIWGQSILRSLIKNSGSYVFNSPAAVFNTNQSESALIKSTGSALMDILLNDPHKINMKAAFTTESLDRLVKASLEVIAEYPELVTEEDGLREIIMQVSQTLALSNSPILRPSMLPEIVRLILASTAQNLDLIWEPGNDVRNLLVLAAQQTLEAISSPIPNATWEPRLTQAQVLSILENILDEVVVNPEWVRDKIANETPLSLVLKSVMRALSAIPKGQRINVEVLEYIIQVAFRAAATNQSIIDSIHWTEDAREVIVLNKALDLLFSFIFQSGKVERANRIDLLIDLLDYIMEVILIHHPGEKGLMLVDLILFDSGNIDYTGGFDEELADQLIEAALLVLGEHPELVSNQLAFKQIVSGVATALHAGLENSNYDKGDLFPEILRLVIEYTALNVDLILNKTADHPDYLLVVALQDLLMLLAQKEAGEKWSPRLTPGQSLEIIENLFEEILYHPEWVSPQDTGTTALSLATSLIFEELRTRDKNERLSAETLEAIIEISLQALIITPELLEKTHWGTDNDEVIIWRKVIAMAMDYTFHNADKGEELLADLLEYILGVIMVEHPDKTGLLLVQMVLFESGVDYSDGFDDELVDELLDSTLQVLHDHADWLAKDEALQSILEGVTSAIDASDFHHPELLPELLRLTLFYTSENMELILPTASGSPQFLLVDTLKQLLSLLSAPPINDQKWQPNLTTAQAVELIDHLFEEILTHPEWVVPNKNGDSNLFIVTHLIFDELRNRDKGERLSPETLEAIITISLEAIIITPELLNKTEWGSTADEIVIWKKVIAMVMDYTFHESNRSEELIADLLAYILDVIMDAHPDRTGLMLTQMILFNSGIDYSAGFDNELADELLDSALQVLHDHSEWLAKDEVLQNIIEGITAGIDASDFHHPDLLPELLRLTLYYSGQNINLIIPSSSGTPKFLLVETLQKLLSILSAPPADDESWSPSLSPFQAIDLIDNLFEEVVEHPEWIYDGDDEHSLFNEVVATVFNTMAKMPKEARFSTETLEWILRNSLRTASRNKAILGSVKWGSSQQEIIIFDKALDLIFEYVFAHSNVGSMGDRTTLFVELVEYVLSVILSNHPDKNGLILIQLILFKTDKLDLTKGFNEGQADDLIDAAVEVLSNYPELATKDVIFRKLLRDTAQAVKKSGYTGHNMVPELIRIMMLQIGLNVDQIMQIKGNGPKNILSLAIEQTLTVIAKKPKAGVWKPTLGRSQILEIITLILEKVQDNPTWVEDEIIFAVIKGIYQAFEAIPEGRTLPHETVVLIIETAIEAVALRKQLVEIKFTIKTKKGKTKRIALTYSLEKLFIELYDEDDQSTGSWTLTQKDTLNAILEYYLLSIAEGETTEAEINAALEKIQAAITDINNNLASNIDDLLEELENG